MAASMSAVAAAICSGRGRVVVQVPLGHAGRSRCPSSRRPGRSRRPGCRGRTRSSRRRCRRRGTARAAVTPASSRGRAGEGQRGLLVAGDAPPARRRASRGTAGGELVRVGGVAGGARWRRADRGRAGRGRSTSAYSPQRGEGAARAPSGASRPVAVDALAEPDDLHPADRRRPACPRRRRRRRRAAGASWCRSRWPRPAPGHGPASYLAARARRHPGGTHGPAPTTARRPQDLVAERVRPGPAQRVRGQRVQALDPVGHAAGAEHAVDLGHVGPSAARARGQVGLVRGPVGRSQLGVGAEPAAISRIRPRGLQRADRGGRARAGQVVQRRERRAVGQPRRGLDHVGQPARAAVRDRHARRAAAGPAGRRRRPGRPRLRSAGSRPWRAGHGLVGLVRPARTERHRLPYQAARRGAWAVGPRAARRASPPGR